MTFSWTPAGEKSAPPAATLTPVIVLYDFDGPVIYVAGTDGAQLLCYKIDEDDDGEQFLVVPTNYAVIDRLRANKYSMLSALSQAWTWIVSVDHGLKVIESVVVSFDELPEHLLPAKGIGLLPSNRPINDRPSDLRPFLSVHFTGGATRSGTLPYGVVLGHLTQVFHSTWRIFSPAISDAAPQASERVMRKVLNIPMHQPGFSSLLIELEQPELDFSEFRVAPKIDIAVARTNIIKANDDFLSAASFIAGEANQGRLSVGSVGDMRGTLEIVSGFVPGADSFFKSVSIQGVGVDSIEREFSIDATAGERIRQVQTLVRKQRGSVYGVVMEVNGMSKTFILRSPDMRQTTCVPTSANMADAVLNLERGMHVEADGELLLRPKRNKLMLDKISVQGGATTYATVA